jgi:hypothetical protein
MTTAAVPSTTETPAAGGRWVTGRHILIGLLAAAVAAARWPRPARTRSGPTWPGR